MERPVRTTKGQSSQNYEEFDQDLMRTARNLWWMFSKKGDLKPIVIPYNSVMFPTTMTIRQKVNLQYKPPKSKVNLFYQGKTIECSLIGVIGNGFVNEAMRQAHQKMADDGGQLSDVSIHESQPSPAPNLKRLSPQPVPSKAKKMIKFVQPETEDPRVELDVDDNETCETVDENETADLDSLENLSNDLVNLFDKKFRQLLVVHEDNARKLALENNRFRARFTDLLRRQKGEETVMPAPSDNSESLIFNGFDLMTLTPVGGASAFGRLLAATIFGAENNCDLITHRLDIKVTKNNCRKAADPVKESLFKECVGRFFSKDAARALRDAIRGANQYGTDMKTKNASLSEINEIVEPDDNSDDE